MVRVSFARRSRAKIVMATPNESDMPPKRTRIVRLGIKSGYVDTKVRLGIHSTQVRPSDHDIVGTSGQ